MCNRFSHAKIQLFLKQANTNTFNFFRAFPQLTKTTFRSGETMFLSIGVGLSAISFALQKEGGQKDAASIPNASGVSTRKQNSV